MMTNEQCFRRGLRALAIDLEEAALDRCLRYCEELLKWNRRINLIARQTTAAEAIDKHFLDCLSLLPLLEKQFAGRAITLLDVGSGAGFPGLVLAATRTDIRVTLVEPRQKRMSFLRHVIRTLGLENVTLCEERLESASFAPDACFDLITGRVVAEPVTFLALVDPYVSRESLVLLMQGKEPLANWYGHVNEQYTVLDSRTFFLPFSGAERSLYLVGKNH